MTVCGCRRAQEDVKTAATTAKLKDSCKQPVQKLVNVGWYQLDATVEVSSMFTADETSLHVCRKCRKRAVTQFG